MEPDRKVLISCKNRFLLAGVSFAGAESRMTAAAATSLGRKSQQVEFYPGGGTGGREENNYLMLFAY